jgi:hypothetical protein
VHESRAPIPCRSAMERPFQCHKRLVFNGSVNTALFCASNISERHKIHSSWLTRIKESLHPERPFLDTCVLALTTQPVIGVFTQLSTNPVRFLFKIRLSHSAINSYHSHDHFYETTNITHHRTPRMLAISLLLTGQTISSWTDSKAFYGPAQREGSRFALEGLTCLWRCARLALV